MYPGWDPRTDSIDQWQSQISCPTHHVLFLYQSMISRSTVDQSTNLSKISDLGTVRKRYLKTNTKIQCRGMTKSLQSRLHKKRKQCSDSTCFRKSSVQMVNFYLYLSFIIILLTSCKCPQSLILQLFNTRHNVLQDVKGIILIFFPQITEQIQKIHCTRNGLNVEG